jgi:hypothetical protein
MLKREKNRDQKTKRQSDPIGARHKKRESSKTDQQQESTSDRNKSRDWKETVPNWKWPMDNKNIKREKTDYIEGSGGSACVKGPGCKGRPTHMSDETASAPPSPAEMQSSLAGMLSGCTFNSSTISISICASMANTPATVSISVKKKRDEEHETKEAKEENIKSKFRLFCKE